MRPIIVILILMVFLAFLPFTMAKTTIITQPMNISKINLGTNLTLQMDKQSIELKPIIKYDGREYDANAISLAASGSTYENIVSKTGRIKFAMKVTTPTTAVSKMDYFALDIDYKGLKHYDYVIDRIVSSPMNVSKKHREYYYRIVFQNGVAISFNDLIENNFTVQKYNDTRWIIGNLSANYKKGAILLDPTVITECGTLDSANTEYQLTDSMDAPDNTCFTIANDNISVDCAGNGINYAISSVGYAFFSDGYKNITVKNCKGINNVDISTAHAFFMTNMENVNINNITEYADFHGAYTNFIYLVGGKNATVSNITLNVPSYSEDATVPLWIENYDNANIFDNAITIESGNTAGIFLYFSNNSLVKNSQVASTAGAMAGISIAYGNNVTLDSVSVDVQNYLGIQLYGGHDNMIRNCYASSGNIYGYGFYDGEENSIMVNSGSSVSGFAFSFGAAKNISIYNSTSSGSQTIRFEDYPANRPSTLIRFINSTASQSMLQFADLDKSNMTIEWYVNVNVTKSTGQPLQATVNVTQNQTNITLFYGHSLANGITPTFLVTELWANKTKIIKYNNHTIIANTTATNITSWNITTSRRINIILTFINISLPVYTDINISDFIVLLTNLQIAKESGLIESFYLGDLSNNMGYTQVCYNASDLLIQKIQTLQISNNTYYIASNQTMKCFYGCDSVTNACSPDPFTRNVMILAVFIAIFIGLVIFAKIARNKSR